MTVIKSVLQPCVLRKPA